jgi:16S rRNA (cytidine1402-2'-O)-methyltransferase
VRGELTLVVAGAVAGPASRSPAELAAEVAAEEAAGADRKEAIRTVVGRTGLSRRVVYDAVVAAKES